MLAVVVVVATRPVHTYTVPADGVRVQVHRATRDSAAPPVGADRRADGSVRYATRLQAVYHVQAPPSTYGQAAHTQFRARSTRLGDVVAVPAVRLTADGGNTVESTLEVAASNAASATRDAQQVHYGGVEPSPPPVEPAGTHGAWQPPATTVHTERQAAQAARAARQAAAAGAAVEAFHDEHPAPAANATGVHRPLSAAEQANDMRAWYAAKQAWLDRGATTGTTTGDVDNSDDSP